MSFWLKKDGKDKKVGDKSLITKKEVYREADLHIYNMLSIIKEVSLKR